MLLLAACGSEEPTPAPDSGTPAQDMGQLPEDAGLTPDAGEDAGQPEDAGQDDTGVEDAGIDDTGVEDAGAEDGGTTITFTGDVWPVMVEAGCNRMECHASPLLIGGAAVLLSDPDRAFRELTERVASTGRRFVEPGAPTDSELYVHGRDANIPEGDLTEAGLEVFGQWILTGASAGPSAPPTSIPTPVGCDLTGSRGLPGLPDACLPRCTAATQQRTIECRDEPNPAQCQAEAFAADPTSPMALVIGAEQFLLNCGNCLEWQTWSCFFEHCPDETLAVFRCGNNCAGPQAALQACITGPARTCQASRDAACFAP